MLDNDHDILVEVHTIVKRVDKGLSNHLRHHWMVTMVLLTALLATLSAVVVRLCIN